MAFNDHLFCVEVSFNRIVLAAALALRETAVRPSLSPSAPKTHAAIMPIRATLAVQHILCPDKVALRGKITVLSGDAGPGPLAPFVDRPGINSKTKIS